MHDPIQIEKHPLLAQLKDHLRSFLPTGLLRLETIASEGNDYIATFERNKERMILTVGDHPFLEDSASYQVCIARLPVLTYLVSRLARHAPIVADFSDGCAAGRRRVAFSSASSLVVLIPDSDFFNSGGYDFYRNETGHLPWAARDAPIVWRGSTTGPAVSMPRAHDPLGPRTNQRIRFCHALLDTHGVDAKISNVVHYDADDAKIIHERGIFGEPVGPMTWVSCRFAFDIDGHTNAWSNLFGRLLNGCCVIKIASPAGFRQWYYDKLVPWIHFVPVEADLSNLLSTIAWCRSHDKECGEIARAGRELALSLTYERELAHAIGVIRREFGSAPV